MYQNDLDAAITENEVLRAENRELNNKYEAIKNGVKVEKKEKRFKKIVEFLLEHWGKFLFVIFIIVMLPICLSKCKSEKERDNEWRSAAKKICHSATLERGANYYGIDGIDNCRADNSCICFMSFGDPLVYKESKYKIHRNAIKRRLSKK